MVLFCTAARDVSRGRDETERHTREIKGDAERGTELVVARIAFANGRVGVVDSGKDAGFAKLVGCCA